MPTKVRWGILGTAGIARKNWRAIANTGNSMVTAVASREPGKSASFISECQQEAPMETVPAPFSTYEELLASKKVDAVYIPVPTGVRKEWVLRAASAGKHIVCEKPCAVTLGDLKEMIEACLRNKVQFMDGVMFRHSARLEKLRQVLEDGESVGDLKRITSAFSYRAEEGFLEGNIRGDAKLEPHGCVGDLGWYCIRLALWAVNWQMPERIHSAALSKSANGLITEFSGELIFAGGVSSSFYCSVVAENQQWAVISGTKGYVQLDDFVLPSAGPEIDFHVQKFDFKINGCDFRMESERRRVVTPEHAHGEPAAQETNLFRNFADQVLSGKLNEQWPREALLTQLVMQACLKAAG